MEGTLLPYYKQTLNSSGLRSNLKSRSQASQGFPKTGVLLFCKMDFLLNNYDGEGLISEWKI